MGNEDFLDDIVKEILKNPEVLEIRVNRFNSIFVIIQVDTIEEDFMFCQKVSAIVKEFLDRGVFVDILYLNNSKDLSREEIENDYSVLLWRKS